MNIRKALGVSFVTEVLIFLISFGSVIVVSRLLTPEEIGIYSVSVALLAFAHVFRDFGVGKYLVQLKSITRERVRAAFTVTLMFSWAIAFVLYLLRGPAAEFYGNRGIAEVLGLVAINFLILPFGSPLMSLLRREMRFGTIAGVRLTSNTVNAGVTIAAALAGESYLSMGWGAVAGNVSNVILLSVIRPQDSLILPSWRGVREVLAFGSKASGVSLIGQLGGSAPDLILGRTLGFSEVAFYSRAASITSTVLGKFVTMVQGVHFPSFAKETRAGRDAAVLYAQSSSYMVGVTVPALAVLALISDGLIVFMFGPQWERSAPLASMLCVFGMLSAPYSLCDTALIACGKVGRVLRIQSWLQFARILVMLTSIWLPLEQVMMLLVATASLSAWLHQYALRNAFGLTFGTLWRQVRGAYLIALFALPAPAVLKYFFIREGIQIAGFTFLAGAALLAALGWFVGVVWFEHPLKRDVLLAWQKLMTLALGRPRTP